MSTSPQVGNQEVSVNFESHSSYNCSLPFARLGMDIFNSSFTVNRFYDFAPPISLFIPIILSPSLNALSTLGMMHVVQLVYDGPRASSSPSPGIWWRPPGSGVRPSCLVRRDATLCSHGGSAGRSPFLPGHCRPLNLHPIALEWCEQTG